MKIRNIILMLMFLILSSMSVLGQIFPSSYTIVEGNYVSGGVNCLAVRGVSCLVVAETANAPAYDIRFNFTNVTSIDKAVITFQHSAGSDEADFEIWDYNFMLWQDLQEVIVTTDYTVIERTVDNYDNFIENGVVQLRFQHEVSGNPSHEFDVYSVSLEPIESSRTCPTNEVDSRNNLILLIVTTLLVLLGFVWALFGVLGGISVLAYAMTIYGCSLPIATICVISGVLIIVYFGSKDN